MIILFQGKFNQIQSGSRICIPTLSVLVREERNIYNFAASLIESYLDLTCMYVCILYRKGPLSVSRYGNRERKRWDERHKRKTREKERKTVRKKDKTAKKKTE